MYLQNEELKKQLLEFQELLSQEPKNVLHNDEENYNYIPISAIEDELDEVFAGLYEIKILSSGRMWNAISYDVCIKFYHPVLNLWIERHGAGAINVFSKTEVEGIDQGEMITSVEMAAPLAYAEAIKNAAKKIGKRFGADLNREHNSKSRKEGSVSSFDVVEFDIKKLQTLLDVKKAYAAGSITKQIADQLKASMVEGKIVHADDVSPEAKEIQSMKPYEAPAKAETTKKTGAKTKTVKK